MIYADTSFLVPLYVLQTTSPLAAAEMRALKEPLAFTPLHRHELRNAVRLCVFRMELTAARRDEVLGQIADDLRAGVYSECVAPWNETFARAEKLGADHSEKLGNRSFDILHVAAALVLEAELFLTFDQRQKALAKAAGLKVRP